MRLFLFIAFLAFFSPVLAQKPPVMGKYLVEFRDKNNSPYCTCRPWEFLSARSLDRRARAGIAVEYNDLPVNPVYLDGLKATGAIIHHSSRWLNAATVIADTATAAKLSPLPFVLKVTYVGRHIVPKGMRNRPEKKRTPLKEAPKAGDGTELMGYAGLQNSLLGMPLLYHAGARGNGIYVAVMDGGFTNVDTLPFFDSLAANGRLHPGWDFIDHDRAVYEGASHGTSVLSVMAAHLPGYFVGTAPDATYFLLKTEDTAGEYPVEETNWIAGAEWADSIGADIINASLGYTSFNDTTLSHRYQELDGRSSIGSRGASIAATKGMIVCNSAGNSGDEPWKYLGVPADATGIVAVGAVGADGKRAGFSSFGPSYDGRIKPDLCAPGDEVVVAGNLGIQLGISSGTSLASPMLAGALAALWSSFPEKTAAEILEATFNAADQNTQPDNERGYGLPDISLAWLRLGGYFNPLQLNRAGEDALFAFHRTQGRLSMLFFGEAPESIRAIRLKSLDGHRIEVPEFSYQGLSLRVLTLEGLAEAPPGAYQLEIVGKDKVLKYNILCWK